METRRDFPLSLKNDKAWARKEKRGSLCWHRMDNKAVSIFTTIDKANDHVQVSSMMCEQVSCMIMCVEHLSHSTALNHYL